MLAPVGSLESFEPGGGITVAKGAGAGNVAMLISSVTTLKLEDIVKGGDGPKIYQLYVRGDDNWVADRVKQAMDAGYDAFCITVDTAGLFAPRARHRQALREVVAHRGDRPGSPGRLLVGQLQAGEGQVPRREVHAEGHRHAARTPRSPASTASGRVYCSNHGGRQLDHGRGSAAVLPEVIDAVKGRAKIAVDGSFSRGSDIVKAICLGADWVGLGRLYCYGLAAAGAAGIERVVELLEEEMKEVMGLLGVTSLKQLDKSYISPRMPTNLPGVHSAFPLMHEGY